MRITKKKVLGTVAAASVIALGAGAAFAYWTGTASGSGTAKVDIDDNMVVSSTIAANLGPDVYQNLTITIENEKPYALFLPNGLKLDATTPYSFAAGGNTPAGGCDVTNGTATSNFEIVDATTHLPVSNSGAINVLKKQASGSEATILNLAIHMVDKQPTSDSANDQNGCKDGTITINWIQA
jgi:hypothetical protein